MRRMAVALVAMMMLGTGISARAATPAACDHPETPSSSEPIELCGVTTLTASRASVVRVVIPQEVTLKPKFGPGLDIEITGNAAMAGFVLADEGWRHVLLAGVTPRITSFPDFRLFYVLAGNDGVSGSETFAPGTYSLYLLADGDPVTVTLRLEGLSGEVRIAPERPADYRGGFLPPRYSVPSGNYYSADRAEQLPKGGLGFRMAWIEVEGPGTMQAGVCRSNVEQEHGWLDCGGWGSLSLIEPEAVGEYSAELFEPSDWERWHMGGVAWSTAPTVRSVGVLAVWLGRGEPG